MTILRKIGGFWKQDGFTLFEVLVAVASPGVIGAGFITALDTNKKGNRVTDEQVTALNLATNYVEIIEQQTYTDNYTSALEGRTLPAGMTLTSNTSLLMMVKRGRTTPPVKLYKK